jgi:hypothetical protein
MRTKEALAAAKRRGTDIGATGRALAARHKAEAIERAHALAAVVALIKAQGFRKVREIRDQLNLRGYPSPGAGRWHLPSVHRLLKRLELPRQANFPKEGIVS